MTFRNTIGEFTGWRPHNPAHDGKIAHASRGKAEAAIRSLYKRGERENGAMLRDGDRLHAYPCNVGGYRHFHTGHNRRLRKDSHGEENRTR